MTNSPILIAFDTVFDQCSIAILQGDDVIYTKTVAGGRGQTEIILFMLDNALKETNINLSDVGVWAFNRGPGAFSGIRINTAVVQALSVANNSPCIGISSLMTLAYVAYEQSTQKEQNMTITAVMDARQNQVYAGDFIIDNGTLISKDEYLLDYDGVVQADMVVGDGVDLVQTNAQKMVVQPTAQHIARLAYPLFIKGEAVTAEHALPVYLRHNAWKTLAEQGKNNPTHQTNQ